MIERPIAHRGLHDVSKGIYENTLSAARAAVEGGYNIELDIQPSSDMVPMVFHDYELERLTSESGETRSIAAQTLTKISIKDTKDKIPTLKEFLKVIDGKVGLVIELKGRKNEDEGFVAAIADLLSDYKGDAVTMSFEHHILRKVMIEAMKSTNLLRKNATLISSPITSKSWIVSLYGSLSKRVAHRSAGRSERQTTKPIAIIL